MDKFFANLGKAGDKKNKAGKNEKQQRGQGGANNSWQGGRSGDMESIRKQSASSRKVGNDGGSKAAGGNTKSGNVFENVGAGFNDALGKMDLFKPNNRTVNTRGGGQSLGGSKPGRVFSVSLDKPGPVGIEIQKRRNSAAIISSIVPNGQADKAGMKRGDIICHPGSNGEKEVGYDQFLSAARSGRRPLRFDVRRIESSIVEGGAASTGRRPTADSLVRKQAVAAAAEAREKKHKAKQKPIPKVEKRMDNLHLKQNQQIYQHDQTVNSEETRQAVAAIKQAEEEDARNLGYNPYEAKAMNSGQARTASVAMTQGEINAQNAPSKMGSSEGDMAAPGRVNKPKDPTKETGTQTPPTPEFEMAFSTVVTSNPDHPAVLKSLKIMRTLISNATTKGQQGDEETSSKFRRVRLSNPKIKAAITDIQGALELMMSVGFVLSEHDDGETYLVFPPGEKGSSWLVSALSMMESYENGGVISSAV